MPLGSWTDSTIDPKFNSKEEGSAKRNDGLVQSSPWDSVTDRLFFFFFFYVLDSFLSFAKELGQVDS